MLEAIIPSLGYGLTSAFRTHCGHQGPSRRESPTGLLPGDQHSLGAQGREGGPGLWVGLVGLALGWVLPERITGSGGKVCDALCKGR